MSRAASEPAEREVTLWLTRQAIGDYMLTATPPAIVTVRSTDQFDAYIRAGDPIGLRHLCAAGMQ